MNFTHSLIAVSVLAASHAQATCYDTMGSMTGISAVSIPLITGLYVHAGSASSSTSPSVFPDFVGNICIDTSTYPATVSGMFADFEQFSTTIKTIGGLAVANQPNLVYSFNGGTTTWTPNTPGASEGTLKLGQTLTMTGGNSQTSDATLLFDTANGAIAAACSGFSAACNLMATNFFAYPNLERFYMTVNITYDTLLGKFKLSGISVGSDVGATTGNFWYSYSFIGIEI